MPEMDTISRVRLDALIKDLSHSRRRQQTLVWIMSPIIIVLSLIILYYAGTQIAFDHCIAYTVAHQAQVGTCHAMQRPNPFGFLFTWFPRF